MKIPMSANSLQMPALSLFCYLFATNNGEMADRCYILIINKFDICKSLQKIVTGNEKWAYNFFIYRGLQA